MPIVEEKIYWKNQESVLRLIRVIMNNYNYMSEELYSPPSGIENQYQKTVRRDKPIMVYTRILHAENFIIDLNFYRKILYNLNRIWWYSEFLKFSIFDTFRFNSRGGEYDPSILFKIFPRISSDIWIEKYCKKAAYTMYNNNK